MGNRYTVPSEHDISKLFNAKYSISNTKTFHINSENKDVLYKTMNGARIIGNDLILWPDQKVLEVTVFEDNAIDAITYYAIYDTDKHICCFIIERTAGKYLHSYVVPVKDYNVGLKMNKLVEQSYRY